MSSKDFRNSPLFLRNEFKTDGRWGFPVIKRQPYDLSSIELISCSDISNHDTNNLHKGIHHFVDDYRFEGLYKHPERSIPRYSRYRFVLTPDYSTYSEMNPWRQIESIGKSRWVGANWQKHNMIVFPTISWGQASSFDYCFDSIEKHCIVAVGMIGCKHNRIGFMRGYNEMLNRIEPEAIICFGSPFPEMEGRIICVNYNSSRRNLRNGR